MLVRSRGKHGVDWGSTESRQRVARYPGTGYPVQPERGCQYKMNSGEAGFFREVVSAYDLPARIGNFP
eukprot:3184979-Rhodomonas_salina.1